MVTPDTILEHSADSLAALFTGDARSNGELRLDVLRWVLGLPQEIDPARAAQILIGRQSRGESAPFSAFAQAMIAEMGRSDRARLAVFPKLRRRNPTRMKPTAPRTEPNESLPRKVRPLGPD